MATEFENQLYNIYTHQQQQLHSLQEQLKEQAERIEHLERHASQCCVVHQTCELCI